MLNLMVVPFNALAAFMLYNLRNEHWTLSVIFWLNVAFVIFNLIAFAMDVI